MKRMIRCLAFIVLAMLFQDCKRYTYQPVNNGSAEVEIRRKPYPRYPIRSNKKDIILTRDAEWQIGYFYVTKGYWPISLEGFMAESDANRLAIQEMYNKGFRSLSFAASGDTMFINFQFRPLRKPHAKEGVVVDLRKGYSGRFVLTMNNDLIYVRKELDEL